MAFRWCRRVQRYLPVRLCACNTFTGTLRPDECSPTGGQGSQLANRQETQAAAPSRTAWGTRSHGRGVLDHSRRENGRQGNDVRPVMGSTLRALLRVERRRAGPPR